MRLGAYDCHLVEGSRVRAIYGTSDVRERHRHRYEVNNVLRYKLLEHGMQFTGLNLERDLVEIIELPEHRWFIGVQFHPEYKSTVGRPHPLFAAFVAACVEYAREQGQLRTPRPPRRQKRCAWLRPRCFRREILRRNKGPEAQLARTAMGAACGHVRSKVAKAHGPATRKQCRWR